MGKKMKLDFTGVESFQRMSEGVHVCKIATADVKQSSGGNYMIVVAFEATKGVDKGSRVYENFALMDTALWKLKGLLQAIGMKCDGKVQLDLDKLVGKTCSVTVKHEEYEGKTRARVDSIDKLGAEATDSEDEVDEDEDFDEEEEQEVEEKPAKKEKAKKPAKKEEPEEPDDEDDDWDEDEEEEEEEEPQPKKKAKKEEKKPVKKSKKATEEDEDDNWDDDDWDEDED